MTRSRKQLTPATTTGCGTRSTSFANPPLPPDGRPTTRVTRAQQVRQQHAVVVPDHHPSYSSSSESSNNSPASEEASSDSVSSPSSSGNSSVTPNNDGGLTTTQTAPSGQESSSDGEEYGTPVRSRQRFTQEETRMMEDVFQRSARPSTETKQTLAADFNTTPQRIQIWFQNRRAKEKKIREVAEVAEEAQDGQDAPISPPIQGDESSSIVPGRFLSEVNERRKYEAHLRRILAVEEGSSSQGGGAGTRSKKRRVATGTAKVEHDDVDGGDYNSDYNDGHSPLLLASPGPMHPGVVGARFMTTPPMGGPTTTAYYHPYQRRTSADDNYNILDYPSPPVAGEIHYTRSASRHSIDSGSARLCYPTAPHRQESLYTMTSSPTIDPAQMVRRFPQQGVYPPFSPTTGGPQVGYLPVDVLPPTMRDIYKPEEVPSSQPDETAYLNILADVSTQHVILAAPGERKSSHASSSGFGESSDSTSLSDVLAHSGGKDSGFNPPPCIEEQREAEESAAREDEAEQVGATKGDSML